MHELIERYIAETVRFLRPQEREDVRIELASNILDMLGENPNDAMVERTLLELGAPSTLAAKYRGRERCLIGPNTFDFYLMVLKLVTVIVLTVTLVLTIITFFFEPVELSILNMVAKTIAALFSAASGVFLWVTITFTLLDYFQINMQKETWNLEALYNLDAASTKEITKREIYTDLIGLTLFMLFLVFVYTNSNLIAIHQRDFEPIPLFMAQPLRPFLIGWMGITLLNFAVSMVKMLKGRWTTAVFTLNTLTELIGIFYFIFIATRWRLYNPEFLAFFNTTMERHQSIVKAIAVALLILTLIGIGHEASITFRGESRKRFHENGEQE